MKRLIITAAAAFVAFTAAGVPAFADTASATVPVTVNVQPGTVAIRLVSGGLTFTGQAGSFGLPSTTNFTLEVSDTSNSGKGWNVGLSCQGRWVDQSGDIFVQGDNVNNTSGFNGLGISGPVTGGQIAFVAGQPINPALGPRETTQGVSFSRLTSTPLKVVATQPGSGSGTYQWTPNAGLFNFDIPANDVTTKPLANGTYFNEFGGITATITTGP